jgi:hypothetical protein
MRRIESAFHSPMAGLTKTDREIDDKLAGES